MRAGSPSEIDSLRSVRPDLLRRSPSAARPAWRCAPVAENPGRVVVRRRVVEMARTSDCNTAVHGRASGPRPAIASARAGVLHKPARARAAWPCWRVGDPHTAWQVHRGGGAADADAPRGDAVAGTRFPTGVRR